VENKSRLRCRHRRHWLILSRAGTHTLWCYECGAIRYGYGRWVKPVGPGGENPIEKACAPKTKVIKT
jgi:hypothetical protein